MSRPVPSSLPEPVAQYLAAFAERRPAAEILRYVAEASGIRTLVLGEAIIDEYVYCEAIGKSSKEPTLVVKQTTGEQFAGGILAVANHVGNFADDVGLVTVLGARDSFEEFITAGLNPNVRATFVTRAGAPTIRKTRFVEQYFFHKLFEVYSINDESLSADDNRTLCNRVRERIGDYDLVVVFDFGHGMMTPELVELVCAEAPFLVVNTQCNAGNLGYHTISKYHRADFVCITEAEARIEARDRHGDIRLIVPAIAGQLRCKRMIVTRGKQGCLCYDAATGFVEVPAFATRIVDRVGAGDAFMSLASLCAYQRAPIEVVGFVGNVAGGLAVETVGNRAPVARDGLTRQIASLLGSSAS